MSTDAAAQSSCSAFASVERSERSIPADVEIETARCPAGCTADHRRLFDASDRLNGLPGVWTIVECTGCGLRWTSPRPTTRSIGAYYPSDYGPYVATRTAANEGSTADAVVTPRTSSLRRLLKAWFGFRTHDLPDVIPTDALEIGCASGSFLERLRREGWRADGLEFSPEAAAHARARGFRVQSGALEEATLDRGKYRLIVGWMVLEHLHDPLGALRRLHDAATPHGWLVLSVPNCGSWEFSAFKGDWYALHVPNHLTHFTPESISRLLELAGWRVERITCQRVVGDFFGSLAFMLERRRRLPRVTAWIRSRLDSPTRLHLLLLPLAIILAAFRQTGRMNVWARRVEQTG